MKFSVIVPVYNVENYIKDCLDSILNQTYDNFEVIVVNDGSPDNSQKIIDDYVKKDKRIKSFIKENGGLSDARNYGVERAEGDYILFVDSDDTINNKLLEKLNDELVKNSDIQLVRYQIQKIDDDNKFCNKTEIFSNLKGEQAFIKLLSNELFVTAWSYCYEINYFKNNNYKYAKGKIHEDFGLTPIIVVNSKLVSAIDYIGYNYMVRENSIMTKMSDDKIVKRLKDCLYHYDFLLESINKSNISEDTKKIFKSYISNAVINVLAITNNNKIINDYLKELKDRKIGENLLIDSMGRKLKKMFFNLFPKLYIKLYVK